eukprot:Awhi_evm1s12145
MEDARSAIQVVDEVASLHRGNKLNEKRGDKEYIIWIHTCDENLDDDHNDQHRIN